MASDEQLITSLLLGGYRSFGSQQQRFERFSKINLLIGPNNSGKSNVLKFIHEIHPKLVTKNGYQPSPLDRHFPNYASFRYGINLSLMPDESGKFSELESFVAKKISDKKQRPDKQRQILLVFKRKAELDGTPDLWFEFGQGGNLMDENWSSAFGVLSDLELQSLWNTLTGTRGGGRDHWVSDSLLKLTPEWKPVPAAMIPAIRSVGRKGTEPNGFSGEGLIERLARLQNPDVHNQPEKQRFSRISAFLQSVTDNRSATIEIPYERDTIVVHMNGKALPLESLGTGIHEVIILAAASTILENTVVCMEEPEIHLNPILQRKLVRYLSNSTSNQYFIATHSAALMDTPDAEIYHVQLRDGQSNVTRVTSGRQRSMVCEDLGYHPSDLLQANCIIWVEGPSDRTYLKYWISKCAPDLQEGVHFSIMFYGGRLAAHISGKDVDEAIDGFISLRRLNRRAVIIIDSDRSTKESALNPTKTRLVAEFDAGPGHAWVTDGREIENYIPSDHVKAAIAAVVPNATAASAFGRYSKVLSLKSPGGKSTQALKVEIAKYIVGEYDLDDGRLDLKARLSALVQFIRESNPSNEKVTA